MNIRPSFVIFITLLSGLIQPAIAGGLALLVLPPKNPVQLQQCPQANESDGDLSWRAIDFPVQLSWQGGNVALNTGATINERPVRLNENCFRLTLDGKLLVAGAVVSEYSARLLTLPVLVEMRSVTGQPSSLVLQTEFSSTMEQGAVVPAWLQTLRARFP